VVAGHTGQSQGTAIVTTTSGTQASGHAQYQGTAAATDGKQLSHTEMNVLKTMITVIVVFAVCWSATEITNFFLLFGVSVCAHIVIFVPM